MVGSFNYPAQELLGSFIKNNEFLILWMLNNNELSTWSDLIEIINKSTLSNYLNKFINKSYVEKLSMEINGRKRNVYRIKLQGKERFYELSQDKKKKKLNYPPDVILRKRNYDHWILWMAYNNNYCKWADFLQEPLSINQSSLSKNMNFLIEKKGFLRKENKEYRITKAGKNEYTNMLRQYDLDRQSILEAEGKRIREITKKTNKFFNKYQIKDKNIKFRYLNNVIKLPYENEKIKFTLDNEENFSKVLLYLSMNHPSEYPHFISLEDFSKKYDINQTKLNFATLRIVEDSIYQIKFFKIKVEEDMNYYFQANEKLEKILKAIAEEHVAKSTYLYNLLEDTSSEIPKLTLESTVEAILDEICGTLFSKGLRTALRNFLPDYIKYLAYKIEKKRELKDTYDKLEGLIWQEIQLYASNNKKIDLSMEKKTEVSIEVIEKEIDLNPKSIDLYYAKTKFMVNKNQFRKVLTFLDTMLKKFPQEKRNIQLIKAYALKEMKNVDEGLKIIDNLIKTYPKDKDLLNYKACWLQYLNQKEESLEIIQNLIKQVPDNALYYDTYGEILMFFNNYKQALEEFQKAIEIDPNSWFLYQTFIKIGICYKVLKNYQLAVEYLKNGKEFTDKSLSDIDTKEKWIVIADLILAEIDQLGV
ncbi:MAG: tetratricopeptide repeat protein [Promethearchaeota archaeon]